MLKYVPGEQKEGPVLMEAIPKDLEYIPFIITEELNYGEAADTVMDMLLADFKTRVLLQTDGQNVADLLHKCVDYASNSLPLHVANIDTTQRVEHTWVPVVPGLRLLLVQWEKHGTAVLLSRLPLPPEMPNVQQPLSRGRDAAHGSIKKNKRSNRKFSPNSRKSWNDNKSKDTSGYEDRRRRQTAPAGGTSEHGAIGYSDDHHTAIATSAAASPGNFKTEQKGVARPRATNWKGTSGANFKSSGTFQSHGGDHSNESLQLRLSESIPGNLISISRESTRKSDDVRLDNRTTPNLLSSDYRRPAMNRRDDIQVPDAVRLRTPHNNDHPDSSNYDHRNGESRWDRRKGGERTDFRNTNTTAGRGRGNKRGGGRGSHQLRNSEFERSMETSGKKNVYPSTNSGHGFSSGVQSSPCEPSNTEPKNHGGQDIPLGSKNLCCGVKIDDPGNCRISSGIGEHVTAAAASTTNLDANDSVAGLRETVVKSSSDVPSVASSSNAANNLHEMDVVKIFQCVDTTNSDPAVVLSPGDRGPTDTVVRSDRDSKKDPVSCSADTGKECYSPGDGSYTKPRGIC